MIETVLVATKLKSLPNGSVTVSLIHIVIKIGQMYKNLLLVIIVSINNVVSIPKLLKTQKIKNYRLKRKYGYTTTTRCVLTSSNLNWNWRLQYLPWRNLRTDIHQIHWTTYISMCTKRCLSILIAEKFLYSKMK